MIYIYSIFVFCSGYGIIKSHKNKTDDLNYFLKEKIFKILIPFDLSKFLNILFHFYVYYYDKRKYLS